MRHLTDSLTLHRACARVLTNVLPAFSACSDSTREGYLEKRSKDKTHWNRRWFALRVSAGVFASLKLSQARRVQPPLPV